MKVIKTFLPTQIVVESEKDFNDFTTHLCNQGFMVAQDAQLKITSPCELQVAYALRTLTAQIKFLSKVAVDKPVEVVKVAPALPEKCQKLHEQIKADHEQLKKNWSSLSVPNRHDIDSLVGEKIPQMIANFLSIDEQYRGTVKSGNKTAEDFLHESLSNIHCHLQNMMLQKHQDALLQLKADSIYTRHKVQVDDKDQEFYL